MTYDNVRATAPLEPSPEQLVRANEQRVLPVLPEKLNDPELRLIRRPPKSPLSDSYRTQRYSFRDGDTHYVLTPELPGTDPGPSMEPPLELPVHFTSNWHGGGAPNTFGDCLAAQDELTARLREQNRSFRPAIAIAQDLTWFEGFAMVAGLEDAQVVELARASGQPAVIRWDADRLVVLPTGLRSDIAGSTTAWRLESTEVATCPVRKDADPAGRCTNYGGPYGGTAIHAAALWRAHRSVAVSLLGCGPCADGREQIWGHPRSGGALSLASEIIGSRLRRLHLANSRETWVGDFLQQPTHGRAVLDAHPAALHRCPDSLVIPGYTSIMKTAISLPDDVFVRATRRAKDLGMSRSEFFARAADRYLDELDTESVTGQINAALEQLGTFDDAAEQAVAAGHRVLAGVDDEW